MMTKFSPVDFSVLNLLRWKRDNSVAIECDFLTSDIVYQQRTYYSPLRPVQVDDREAQKSIRDCNQRQR